MHTGNQNMGYGSIGSWLGYGLGSENENLPGFVVLVSGGKVPSAGKSAWGAGFLPSVYQGVQCRSEGDPVLFLSDPKGISRPMRERILSAINEVNQQTYQEFGDPETLTRISQYEMAANMQLSATEAMDLADEPQHIHDLYGTEPGKESFANNCVLARDSLNAVCDTSSCFTGVGIRTVHPTAKRSTQDSSGNARISTDQWQRCLPT